MPPKQGLIILSFAAAVLFGLFAAFGWTLGDLRWQDEVAAALSALGAGFLIGALP